jgi:MOSC domain-containing protein YiiM
MSTWTCQVFVGGVGALAQSGRPSAIVKRPVARGVAVTALGLSGDAQADTRVHGGPDKAVHLYPADHYAVLARQFPELAGLLVPGVLGENLSVAGLGEHQVHVGQVWRVGTVRMQVCQPRMPCWKIDARLGQDGVAAFIDAQGLTGWYLRVLQDGQVAPGDALMSEPLPRAAPTLAQALHLCAQHRPDLAALSALAQTPGIAENWANKLSQRVGYLQALHHG